MAVCVKSQVQWFNECVQCLEALGVERARGDSLVVDLLAHSSLDKWDASLLLKMVRAVSTNGNNRNSDKVFSRLVSAFSSCENVQSCFMSNGLNSVIDFSLVREFYETAWTSIGSSLERQIVNKIQQCFQTGLRGDVLGISSLLVLLLCPSFFEPNNAKVLIRGLKMIEYFAAQHRAILKGVLEAFSEQDMNYMLQMLHILVTLFLESSVIDESECILALNWISILFETNQVTHVVSHKAFYHNGFNDSGCIHDSEHERFREFCFPEYPFLFNGRTKSRIMKKEFDVIRTDAWMRISNDSPLFLAVNRDSLLDDAIRITMKASQDGILHNPIIVTFVGEVGADQGGLSREFFRVAFKQLFSPEYGMFVYDDESNLMWFRSSDLDLTGEFYFTGILLGLALFNGFVVNLQLPLVFYKKLLGQELTAEDLKDVHLDIYRNLKQLLDMDSDVESLGLCFAVDEDAGLGQREEVLLKPNGDEIAVTDENKHEYAKLYAHHLLETRVKSDFEPLRSGFLEVCRSQNLNLLQPIELEEIICGMKTTDITDLKANTVEGSLWPS